MRWKPVKTEAMSATDRAAELRRAFDLSFAEPPRAGVAAAEDFLAVRLGASPYALRVREISGLVADLKIAPVPTIVPALLGIGGFRGAILPVYDLRALLGHPADTKPRWLAIAAAASVGLAFDAFEGQLRVHHEAMVPDGRGDTTMRHVREVVQLEGLAWPLVSVASVLEAITRRVRAGGSERE
jgi:chemotaxis signal transduction protein